MEKYIWVGHREGEIFKTNNFFERSITSWGSGKNDNISYSAVYGTRNIDNKLRNEFIAAKLKELLLDKDYKVMFYASTLAYSLLKKYPEFKELFVCLNSKNVLELLNNKITTRLWMSNHLPVLKFILCSGADCQFKKLKSFFPGHTSFVIQEANSSGGLGTFLVTYENHEDVLQKLNKDVFYLISYFAAPSFSINDHILITGNNIVIFPPSLQIIENCQSHLIYSGADYISYRYIKENHKEKVYHFSKKIGHLLQKIGYRGICGIDYLVYNDEVYFVEINPRFQASTLLLNIALDEAGLPCMQELQLDAFSGRKPVPLKRIEQLRVNYSLYRYRKESQDVSRQYLDKFSLLSQSDETKFLLYDGFAEDVYPDNTYLYQVVWERHISSCGEAGKLHLHPNIPLNYFMENSLPLSYELDSIIRLKIALLNQGVRILPEAYARIKLDGGYNESVFHSIDLTLFKHLRINTPVNINLASLSPFSIGYKTGKYVLYYYHKEVSTIDLEFSKSIEHLKTKNNIPYKSIAFISGDRLRIKPEKRCFFKATGIGCQFCPGNKISETQDTYSLSDIEEVIDYCIDNEHFRHILIGGGSADPSTDENRIIPVIEYIRSKTNKSIYLMCLPPNDINYVNKYIEAGVNEIAFNIELFDRKLASEYMPGKGRILLEDYLSKLERAAALLLQKGNVRTMLIVGLEPISNTLCAIKLLASKGIQPMLSIFRPSPTCKLSHIIQPSNEDIYDLFCTAEKICKQYGLFLGPSCPSCQNNTLSLALKSEVADDI